MFLSVCLSAEHKTRMREINISIPYLSFVPVALFDIIFCWMGMGYLKYRILLFVATLGFIGYANVWYLELESYEDFLRSSEIAFVGIVALLVDKYYINKSAKHAEDMAKDMAIKDAFISKLITESSTNSIKNHMNNEDQQAQKEISSITESIK
jgi:hypothetical protein